MLSCFLRPLSSQVDTPASNLHIPPQPKHILQVINLQQKELLHNTIHVGTWGHQEVWGAAIRCLLCPLLNSQSHLGLGREKSCLCSLKFFKSWWVVISLTRIRLDLGKGFYPLHRLSKLNMRVDIGQRSCFLSNSQAGICRKEKQAKEKVKRCCWGTWTLIPSPSGRHFVYIIPKTRATSSDAAR